MDNIYDQIRNKTDMLQGCVNRMCVTQDPKELESMKDWAHKYIDSIYAMKKEQLK